MHLANVAEGGRGKVEYGKRCLGVGLKGRQSKEVVLVRRGRGTVYVWPATLSSGLDESM